MQSEKLIPSKKTYRSPQLVEWGSLTDLTLGNGGAGGDSLLESGTTGLIVPTLPDYLPNN